MRKEVKRGVLRPERWNPPPPSPRGAEAGVEAPAAGSLAEASAGAAEAPLESSRKRKRGFSNLR
jgi:hypothetical protein